MERRITRPRKPIIAKLNESSESEGSIESDKMEKKPVKRRAAEPKKLATKKPKLEAAISNKPEKMLKANKPKAARTAKMNTTVDLGDSDESESGVKIDSVKPKKKTVKRKAEIDCTAERVESRKQPSSSGTNTSFKPLWTIEEVLATEYNIQPAVSKKFTSLIKDDCTLPFIARYRKEAVGNLDIDELRKMKSSFDELQKLQEKIEKVVKALEKQNQLTDTTKYVICNSRDIEELNHWYAPFKETKKSTLAGRAKELGLEDPALKIFYGSEDVPIGSLVNKDVEGLSNNGKVIEGIQHIISDIVGKDAENITHMECLTKDGGVQLKSSKSKNASKQEPDKIAKFESYFASTFYVNTVKPHIVLALNRGELLKVLSVKVQVPEAVKNRWTSYCCSRYINAESSCQRTKMVRDSIEDAYDRIVEPYFVRKIRSKLTETAHRAAIDVFAVNLKSLLLSPPMKSTNVLGLDPGFKHGCKCAAVAADGSILHTETIYIRFNDRSENQPAAEVLKKLVHKFRCSTIALGNGTACRETEMFLSNLIQRKYFQPNDVQYTIVSEAGASIYSCSPEAKAEFPLLDPNVISAISIARRLQDPLTEFVRVSPQHLGIGMYQHDVSVKRLETSLDDIVTECVSFVGVDLNTCPLHVLSKVAGLTENKAKKIIEHRQLNGPFKCRQQLEDVKMIGPKTFEQCAGFLRISESISELGSLAAGADDAEPAKKKMKKKTGSPTNHVNTLDRTCVHPESYLLAQKIIQMADCDSMQIGHSSFIQKLGRFLQQTSVKQLSLLIDEPEEKLEQIVGSLQQPLQFDLREKFDKPLFKKGVTSLSDLKMDQVLTGQVSNVTHFGAFIDIGVGTNGLLHSSKMKGKNNQISAGSRITVRVTNIELARERIGLEFVSF